MRQAPTASCTGERTLESQRSHRPPNRAVLHGQSSDTDARGFGNRSGSSSHQVEQKLDREKGAKVQKWAVGKCGIASGGPCLLPMSDAMTKLPSRTSESPFMTEAILGVSASISSKAATAKSAVWRADTRTDPELDGHLIRQGWIVWIVITRRGYLCPCRSSLPVSAPQMQRDEKPRLRSWPHGDPHGSLFTTADWNSVKEKWTLLLSVSYRNSKRVRLLERTNFDRLEHVCLVCSAHDL